MSDFENVDRREHGEFGMDAHPLGEWVDYEDYTELLTAYRLQSASLVAAQSFELPTENEYGTTYWKDVVGGSYTPAVLGKHAARHISHAKRILDSYRGTETADLIVALIFDAGIVGNRAQFFIDENAKLRASLVAMETEKKVLEIAYGCALERHGCCSKNCTEEAYIKEAEGMMNELASLRAEVAKEWIDLPDSQGSWWHCSIGGYPFMYQVLASGSFTPYRYFIAFPDSRWCDSLGGKWMKAKEPAPYVTIPSPAPTQKEGE